MELIRNWVINVSAAVFFIIAVEMILPDNKMKKYCKFVLGLILMTVFINPIVMLINRGESIIPTWQSNIERYAEYFTESNVNSQEYANSYIQNTLKAFEENIKKVCEDKLKAKYSNYYYLVEVKASYSEKESKYNIDYINIGVSSSTVKKVEKVDISKSNKSTLSNESEEDQSLSLELKTYLNAELQIDKEKIKVYKK